MDKKQTFLLLAALLLGGMLVACTNGNAIMLAGTSWRLSTLNGSVLPSEVDVTLNFEKDNAGGRAACNSYGGWFTQSGSKLSFGGLFQTEMWCEGLMDYESAYLAALGTVRSFMLNGDRLSLLDRSGNSALVFVRQ